MQHCIRTAGVSICREGGTVIYDEASQLLLKITPLSIYFYSLHSTHQGPKEVRLSEGPPVVAAAVSLDGRMLALQRSPGHLQFMELSSTKTFVQGSWKGKSDVMGFFWTATPDCNFVMITKSGVEAYQLQANCQGLASVQQHPLTVRWWKFSHAAGVLLLGTGEAGLWLQAYQYSPGGILRLPPFQLISSGAAPSGSPLSHTHADSDTISILTLYARVYCAVLDRKERCLSLYRFYKDAVQLQHRFDVPSPNVQLTTSDDLLLAFHPRLGQATVIDVASEGFVAAGLPINFPDGHDGAVGGADDAARVSKLEFKLPNTILDPACQVVLRSQVDVDAVARKSGGCVKTIGFILRRSPALHETELARRALLLVREALIERVGLESVRHICDTVNSHQDPKGPQTVNKVPLTPQVVCREVFAWIHNEEAVDAQYLQAAIAEYQASASAAGVEVPLMQQILAFEVALQLGQHYQVALEVAVGHEKDCKALAGQLEAWEGLPHSRWLADGIRQRTEDWESLCQSLLQQGMRKDFLALLEELGLETKVAVHDVMPHGVRSPENIAVAAVLTQPVLHWLAANILCAFTPCCIAFHCKKKAEEDPRKIASEHSFAQVVEALRVAQRHSLSHLFTPALLQLAGKKGDVATFTAVYRTVCQNHLPADDFGDFPAVLRSHGLKL